MSRLVLQQVLRYDYPAPIRRLRHHLMVLPPERHGSQRRLSSSLDVRGAAVEVDTSIDGFGNVAIDVRAARVQAWVEFVVNVVVEREGGDHLVVCSEGGGLLDATPLTEPDRALAGVAGDLFASGDTGWALADRVNAWVAAAMRYRHDVTTVSTTAAEALAIGQGVCQDYAHVMIALCRLLGLPARYVSGHLIGEGGSHAWVEVLLPSGAVEGALVAVPFDPTNNRRAGDTYLTVAVGRDYADVAPTHGTYTGGPGGGLTSFKALEQEQAAEALVPA